MDELQFCAAPGGRRSARLAWLWGPALVLSLNACKNVAFYERAHFARAVMDLDDGAAEAHFQQKVFYSEEGSAGGIGTTAGGGCGCY